MVVVWDDNDVEDPDDVDVEPVVVVVVWGDDDVEDPVDVDVEPVVVVVDAEVDVKDMLVGPDSVVVTVVVVVVVPPPLTVDVDVRALISVVN